MAQKSEIKTEYFLLAILPILLFLTFDWMRKNLGQPDLHVPLDVLGEAPAYAESIGRNRFIGVLMLYLGAVVVVLAYYLWDIRQSVARKSWIVIAFTASILTLPVVLSVRDHQFAPERANRVFDHIGSEVFAKTLSFGDIPACTSPEATLSFWTYGENPVMSMFVNMLDVVNLFTALAIAALVTGAISTLSRPRGSVAVEPVQLGHLQRRLRIYVELSGLVLTLGMVLTMTWMHWPMPFLAKDAIATYSALVNSVLLEFGAFYSLLILTFYLPVAAIHNHWINTTATETLGNEMATHEAVSKWRAQFGLDTNHLKLIRTLLAVSAPSLASVAGGVFA